MNKRGFYYNSLKSQLEHILGDDVGYKKYQEMDEIYTNEIRRLWEIVELKEVKHPTPIKTPKDERKELRHALALQQIFAIYGKKPRNLCKQFKLEDSIHNDSFNDRFSDPEFKHILYIKNNHTERFLNSIVNRIKNKSNVIIVISGDPGTGKSEGGITIGKYIQHKFMEIKHKDIKIHFAFSSADFNIILTKMKGNSGDLAIQDEKPRLAGSGSINTEKYLENVAKAIRMAQNSFIFIDPIEITKTGVFSYYLETAGKYKKERITRFIIYDSKHKIKGHIYIPLHDDTEFRKEYEKRKQDNIDKILENAGMVIPEMDIQRLERDIKNLAEWCIKQNITKKGEIRSEIPFFNSQSKNKIKGDTNYINIVVNKTYQYKEDLIIQEQKKHKRSISKIRNKKYKNFKEFFIDFIQNEIDEKTARTIEEIFEGYTYDIISSRNRDISRDFAQEVADNLGKKKKVSNPILGFLLEEADALRIGVPKEFIKEVVARNINIPDIEWEGKIISVKFRNYDYNSLPFSQEKDFGPEYKRTKELGLNKYDFHLFNPKWSNEFIETIIDINGPDEVRVWRPGKEPKMLKF